MLFLDQFVSAGKIPGVQNWNWWCLCVLCNIMLEVFKVTQGHASHKNKFEELCRCSHFCLSVVFVLCKCVASLYLFFTKDHHPECRRLSCILNFNLPYVFPLSHIYPLTGVY